MSTVAVLAARPLGDGVTAGCGHQQTCQLHTFHFASNQSNQWDPPNSFNLSQINQAPATMIRCNYFHRRSGVKQLLLVVSYHNHAEAG